MAQTVIGLFDSASDAQKAVTELVNSGFSRDNIDVSSSGAYSNSGSSSTGSSSTSLGSTDLSGTTGSNYGTGSTSLGSTDLTGTTGSNYGTGSTLGKVEAEGEGIGHSISKFFSNLFGNDDEANTYSGVAQKGGSVVTVHAQSSSEAEKAADILDDNGAVDVNEKASQYGMASGTASTAAYGTTGTSTTNKTTDQGTQSIPIIEEELQVGKRTVQTGGARLRSRIVERPVEESLRLREERVTVERTPVNRAATDADFTTFKEGTIELTESAEVPVVSKEARVVEEVSLGKEVQEREETIRDTVRSTEVHVEDLEKSNLRTGTSSTSTGSTGTTSNSNLGTDLGTGSSTSGSGVL